MILVKTQFIQAKTRSSHRELFRVKGILKKVVKIMESKYSGVFFGKFGGQWFLGEGPDPMKI